MTMKKITFEFPSDAWEGIMLSHSTGYQEKINQFDPVTGTPQLIDNPLTKEAYAIERIVEVISDPWKQGQISNAIIATQKAAQQQVEARAKEVREATKISVENVE